MNKQQIPHIFTSSKPVESIPNSVINIDLPPKNCPVLEVCAKLQDEDEQVRSNSKSKTPLTSEYLLHFTRFKEMGRKRSYEVLCQLRAIEVTRLAAGCLKCARVTQHKAAPGSGPNQDPLL